VTQSVFAPQTQTPGHNLCVAKKEQITDRRIDGKSVGLGIQCLDFDLDLDTHFGR
jgi:hypothetical protein